MEDAVPAGTRPAVRKERRSRSRGGGRERSSRAATPPGARRTERSGNRAARQRQEDRPGQIRTGSLANPRKFGVVTRTATRSSISHILLAPTSALNSASAIALASLAPMQK